MKSLVTGDLHLTDTPEDEYRWEVFARLRTHCEKNQCSHIFVLGDVTDKKDKHSARLVNRICDNLQTLTQYAEIHVLKGNHDYVDPELPYLLFTDKIPRVHFHRRPFLDSEERFLILPHTRDPISDWSMQDTNYPLVLMHQTFDGALASNGHELSGELKTSWFGGCTGILISGDIHVPQEVGPIVYVGSPHPVRFGDRFSPRFLLVSGDRYKSVPLPSIRKLSVEISSIDELILLGLDPGDQLKLTVSVSRGMVHEWDRMRAEISEILESLEVFASSIVLSVREESKSSRIIGRGHRVGMTYFRVRDYLETKGLDREMVDRILSDVKVER